MQPSLHDFISYPNYQPTLRSNKIVFRGRYKTLDDIIRNLYRLNFKDKHIRDVYSTFHETEHLVHALHTVRAVIIQTESVCCGFDNIHVLDNTSVPLSERVIYIHMHDYVGGRLRCPNIQNVIYILLGLFAITGLIISLHALIEMIISS